MKEGCLWHDTSPEPTLPLAPLQADHTTEVAVIGGGITGLSTALHLAEAGVGVTLLEAGEIPSGGSGRNVGLVNAGLWIPPDDICEALGERDGERANAILGGAPAEVFSLIERHAIDCRATRSGTLHLAHNAKGEQELARRVDQFQRRGAPVELLEDEACRQKTGTQRIRCALLDRRAGTINPVAYTRGLARAAATAGARLHGHSAATGIARHGSDWRITTAEGSVTAPRLVIATNAYTEDHWNQVRRHFFPGHFFQVASHPLPDEIAGDILPERQGAWDTRMVLSSMRRDSEGRLILGSLGKGTADLRPMSAAGPTASSATTSPSWGASTGNVPGPGESPSLPTTPCGCSNPRPGSWPPLATTDAVSPPARSSARASPTTWPTATTVCCRCRSASRSQYAPNPFGVPATRAASRSTTPANA
ncbi:glycine/D-amino acid oxidase-like deaminating enzyme [Halomonas organivorans]|uniref:Glycine/D-amino acid oxidase-like deaminating enzyme n=1 Tax=Halomonas organivorans TaxID=257772 RepID=A0A7W5G4Y6_9GAMM|nr:FAD-binding oxidoreductase [Halomonas organivorans]MBB3140447.1 glycine/D-amino acid oxidase-like deaminating enzyme [Halomonas organivorans]